jgi:hypothetical protein
MKRFASTLVAALLYTLASPAMVARPRTVCVAVTIEMIPALVCARPVRRRWGQPASLHQTPQEQRSGEAWDDDGHLQTEDREFVRQGVVVLF